jgi:hypothetical protein
MFSKINDKQCSKSKVVHLMNNHPWRNPTILRHLDAFTPVCLLYTVT